MSDLPDNKTRVEQLHAEVDALILWRKKSPRKFWITFCVIVFSGALYICLFAIPLRHNVKELLDRQQDVEIRLQKRETDILSLQGRLDTDEALLKTRTPGNLVRTVSEKATRRATNLLARIPSKPVTIWPLDTSSEGRQYCEHIQRIFVSAGWTNCSLVKDGIGLAFKGVLVAGYDLLPADLKSPLDELFRDEYSEANQVGAFSRKNRDAFRTNDSSLMIFVGAQ